MKRALIILFIAWIVACPQETAYRFKHTNFYWESEDQAVGYYSSLARHGPGYLYQWSDKHQEFRPVRR